ncbi:MAG: tRNA pseudouridine synthase A [Bdellovibrionota bacterium]
MNAQGTRSRRIKLRLEFDGSLFCGWQLQSEEHEARTSSVQGEMERALRIFCRSPERVMVQGCGRTDAGVSAREFFMHCDLPESTSVPNTQSDLEKLRHSLNGILPEGVAVTRAESADEKFNALHDVRWKTYEYALLLRRAKPTLDRATSYWIPEAPENFDIEEVRKTLAVFTGRHDFKAFAASDHTAQTTVREIFRAELVRENVSAGEPSTEAARLRLRFTGEGFLKYMVRTLSGTLVEVGQGKRDALSVAKLLEPGILRPASGHCAPAHALSLVRVSYGEP